MIRPDVLERAKERMELLVAEGEEAAAAISAEPIVLNPEETAELSRWCERRAAEEFRAGEEAIERAVDGRPPEERRQWLAAGYRFYHRIHDALRERWGG